MRPLLPTLRCTLLSLHRTLLRVQNACEYVDQSAALSRVEKMVILLEDQRFLNHVGVDGRSIIREAWKAVTGQRHGGASTIDMQFFRTASRRYERTGRRKLREAFGALIMQKRYTKVQILRGYLEIAYFGTGLRGVSEATLALYPGRNPEDLSWEQAAMVAALLVYPKPRLININWSTKVRRRADYGLALYARRKKQLDQISI